MTPPIRSPHPPTVTTVADEAVPVSVSVPAPTGRAQQTSDFFERFRAAPSLSLRSEPLNPFRSTRPINTLGDIRDALVFDIIKRRLTSPAGMGPQVVQQLGSFPGFLQPNRPVGHWNVDEKPDFNVVGDAETILRCLAHYQGWNAERLERNLNLARRGMVYYNLVGETQAGPVPFKLGILDTRLWREGTFYFDMRASMLPGEGTYVYFRKGESGYRTGAEVGLEITRSEFEQNLRASAAAIMGRTLDTLTQESFTAEELVKQRFRHQFAYYESYRFFENSKGAKQRARFEREGASVPEMIAPALRDYLLAHPGLFHVYDGTRSVDPAQISGENLMSLRFVSLRTPTERLAAAERQNSERWDINRKNLEQTLINIESNRSSRPSYHRIGWLAYFGRKVSRWIGIEAGLNPRVYSRHASVFESGDVNGRLGRTDNPIRQMIILAGYGAGDESRPEVFRDIADYAEAEIGKGAKPNILIRGNNPSKFTMPVRGVPVVAYRFMDALRSPAFRDIVVAGTPDVGVVLDAFQNHFAAEIASRGKRFIFVDTGLEGGGFAKNLQQGLDALPGRGEIAVLSYGDTPRVDPHNIAYHPWRHSMDYIFGANGRDVVLDFMGMNAHYQGAVDGVEYPLKEGNVQGLRQMPPGLFQEMFDNRKSVKSGPLGKALIFLRYLLSRPYHPNILNVPYLLGDVASRSLANIGLRAALGRQAPRVAASVDLAEQAMDTRLRWAADFRPGHLDMGGLVDVDGIRDYVVAEALSYHHNHPHWEELNRFAKETLGSRAADLPALEGTPRRINELYLRLRETILQREAERPSVLTLQQKLHNFHVRTAGFFGRKGGTLFQAKLGITDETLRRMGFDPDVMPFREDGGLNQEWLDRTVPPEEIQRYRRAFEAYDNRTTHAAELQQGFFRQFEATQPYGVELRVAPKIQNFVRRELNVDPERYRGMILEWDYSRIETALVQRAQRRFGEFAPEVAEVRRYFEQSTAGNYDTPLRRMLHGFKSVDVLRRYQDMLSPAEFQRLYPALVETIHDARETIPGNRHASPWNGGLVTDGKFFLRGFLDQAQRTADEIYVRRVGESPPEYRTRGWLASSFSHSNDRPPILRDRADRPVRVDSPAFLRQDVALISRRLRILPSRFPHLVAAASMATNGGTLNGIASERMSFDRLLAWTQSGEGQAHLHGYAQRYSDSFRNRFTEGAPGLAVGLAGMLGAERLATEIGLDPRTRPHERFMFVTGAGHLLNQSASTVSEVLINRSLGTSFNYVTTRTVQAGGGLALQYGFEARPGLGRSLIASLGRSFALEGSLPRVAYNSARGLAAMPFRAAWGMGPGLMASAVVDRTVGRIFEEGSTARDVTRMGSFFLPDIYRIAVGNRGPAFLSGPTMRFASRAFAAGFIADMAFAGANRLIHGSEGSARLNMIQQRANQLNDADESLLRRPIDGAFEMIAPQIASWWDSTELTGKGLAPNRHRLQAEGEIRAFHSETSSGVNETLRQSLLFGGQGEELTPEFYDRVDYSSLRGDDRMPELRRVGDREIPVGMIAEHLRDPEVRRRLSAEGEGGPGAVAYLQNQFRGYRLTRSEVERVLAEIRLHGMRRDLASLNQLHLPEAAELGRIFDERGALRSGSEEALLARVYDRPGLTEAGLIENRRLGLAFRILETQGRDPMAAARYVEVGRRIGLVGTDGSIADPEIRRLAEVQLAGMASDGGADARLMAPIDSPHPSR